MGIIAFDQQFSEKLESLFPQNKFFENIFIFLSSEGNYKIVYIFLALYLIYYFKNDKFKLTNIFGTIISSFAIVKIFKNIFDRDRPFVFENIKTVACSSDYSFPSGHATLAFGLATTLSLISPRYKYFYFLVAILISYARIYLNCHYFGDVLAGAILGFSISHFVYFLCKKFFK